MRRGIVPTREAAQRAIAERRVTVSGTVAERPARLVARGEPVELAGGDARYVSRGGDKLAAALTHFAVTVAGKTALDAGSSTGGFTDCLLQFGARLVLAVDVGRGQLHHRLRSDPRVHVLERTDIRAIEPARVAAETGVTSVDLVTADLSFISLRLAVPVLCGPTLAPDGDLLLLVKPQFEAGRREASRGRGVIRDPIIWRRTLGEVADACSSAGGGIMGAMPSPVLGAAGNTEFFLRVRRQPGSSPDPGLLDRAVEAAGAPAAQTPTASAPSSHRRAGG